MNFANEDQIRAYFEAQMRKQRAANEYDEHDEPTFAEWLRDKFMKTRVVKSVQKADKVWEKTKQTVGKFIVDYSYVVGAVATIAYASYILTREPAAATSNEPAPLGLPELEAYAQEAQAKEEDINIFSIEGMSKMKEKLRTKIFD